MDYVSFLKSQGIVLARCGAMNNKVHKDKLKSEQWCCLRKIPLYPGNIGGCLYCRHRIHCRYFGGNKRRGWSRKIDDLTEVQQKEFYEALDKTPYWQFRIDSDKELDEWWMYVDLDKKRHRR